MATDLLYIFIEEQRNVLKLQKMSKNWSWEGTGLNQDQKFDCSDNPADIWHKTENSSKTGHEKKVLYLFLRVF